ncbi:hypothetical protein QMA90_01630 [Mycoplasma sp. M6879]|nr:hypothetical protein [Mycoplasma phocimorsus]
MNNLSSFFKKKITKRILIYFFWIIFLTLLFIQNWSINIDGFKQFKNNIIKLFNPTNLSTYTDIKQTSSLFVISISFLWISIKYTLIGTFLGFILAILTSFMSSVFLEHKFIKTPIKILILIIHSIPELLYIYLFSSIFSSYLALCFIMFFFSWIWIHKYLLEILNTIDLKLYNNSNLQGNSKIKSFFIKIYPIIKNRYFERFLYSFESNLRWGSIIALTGLPGIALLIKYAQESTTTFNQFLIPALILSAFLLMLELINIIFKKLLFENKTKIYKQNKTIYDFRILFVKIIFVLLVIFSIYTLYQLDFRLIYSQNLINKLKQMFVINFNVFNIRNKLEDNIYYSLLQSISFSLLCATFSICFSLFWIRFSNLHLNKKPLYLTLRFLNTLFRSLPVIIIFFILNPLFINPILLLIFTISFHKSLSISKQIIQSIDSIDKNIINNLKMQMRSNNWIFNKYIFKKFKNEFLSVFLILIELSFRYSISYSIIASNDLIIGTKISNIFNEKICDISLYTPYIWSSFFTIISLNMMSYKLNINKTKYM